MWREVFFGGAITLSSVGTCRGTSSCGDDAKTPVGKPIRADQDLVGGRAKRVIVPLRGTDWGVVSCPQVSSLYEALT